jgi:hypothetical protein
MKPFLVMQESRSEEKSVNTGPREVVPRPDQLFS